MDEKTSQAVSAIIGSKYIQIYEPLLDHLSMQEAAYLTAILKEWEFRNKSGELYKGEWVFYKRKRFLRDLRLTERQQSSILRKIKGLGLIEVRRFGIPSKNYYRPATAVSSVTNKVTLELQIRTDSRDKTRTNKTNNSSSLQSKERGIANHRFANHFKIIQKRKQNKIIKHWCSKGKPFIRLQTGKGTKSERKARQAINIILKQGYGYDDITFAIDSWFSFLTSEGSCVNPHSGFYKGQSLLSFFRPEKKFKDMARRHKPPLTFSSSPLIESLKGFDRLSKKYHRHLKDPNPVLSEAIQEQWEERFPNVLYDVNDFIIAAKKWGEFIRENPLDTVYGSLPLQSLPHFFDALDSLKKVNDSGLLRRDWIYSSLVPGYLKENEFL